MMKKARIFIPALLLPLALSATAVLAQSPFAVPGSDAPAELAEPGFFSGLLRYIMAMQQEYYRAMASALRAVNLQQSASAMWGLVSISFLYGVFHAAGPGHGKIVVTSYLLADEREVKRGIVLAFLSAFAQALTAIAVVGVLAVLLGFSSRATASTVPIIERASFILIAGVGVWLIWRTLRRKEHSHHDHAHGHDHHCHDHDHAHMPGPAEIREAATRGWKGMAAIIASIGLRPCSGAILVLLFALTQGAFTIGALSAFAMSVGTAITVSALAILTVFSKNMALRLAGQVDSRRSRRIEKMLRIGGGALLVVMGLVLFAGSLTAPAQPLF